MEELKRVNFDSVFCQNVRDAAINVARYLKTSYESKKHGGYNIYNDEQIHISLDTYYPNLDIDILKEGKKIEVYRGSRDNVTPALFRPGKWIDHLMNLNKKAIELNRQQEDTRKRNEIINFNNRYSPID